MDYLTDAFDMVFTSVRALFSIQGFLWGVFGFLPTFILVFVAATFFRYIVLRMFGAASAGASDSVRRGGHDE